uniref:Uncharacterized protein n=1 Tax=Daphnia galeata TaxID=27404 RepID=A0A8J2RD62_9CRUS|nr:unnamed protein product [Daphnia galeata]
MLLKFCLALLVTLSSATLNQHQYRHPWDMENDHQDPPSVIYVLPDSEFKKYQTKNLQTPVQEENPNRENHGWGKFQIHPRYSQNPSSINAMTPNFNPIHYPTHQLQTPVQKGVMSGEMWNKSPNRFQIQPLHHWETENYRHQNPSSNNAITLKFNLVHYPSQEMLQEQSKIGDISKKDSLDQKIEKCQVINSKLVVVSEKKCQDLEEMLSLSKKKETEFAKENEVLSAKVKNKNNSDKIILDSEKKKYKELEEHSNKKEIEFAKEIEKLNTNIEKLMQKNKNQEEQLTGYKDKLTVLSSAFKRNFSQELINSKLLVESEKEEIPRPGGRFKE